MPIPLTCSCGAKLEIDDKFVGQSITCPDCQKPLRAEPPAPLATRTSGLAITSLLLALVGAFTVVGTLAAIACGAVAYRRLTARRGSAVGGVRLAQAGMILGALFTVIAIFAYSSSRSLLGLDGLFRQYVWGKKLRFDPASLAVKPSNSDGPRSLERPSHAWGKVDKTSARESDLVMLVNIPDDAVILWLTATQVAGEDDKARAIAAFRESDFVKWLGGIPAHGSDALKERNINDAAGEFMLDVYVGGHPWTFLFRITDSHDSRMNILVGGAKSARFAKLEPTFRNSLQLKQD